MNEPKAETPVRTVDDLDPDHWIARQLPPGTSLRCYFEDRTEVMVMRAMLDAIDTQQVQRSEIASVLGVSRSWVSQALNGYTSMTLKTLGALLWAAGYQIAEIRVEPISRSERPHHG